MQAPLSGSCGLGWGRGLLVPVGPVYKLSWRREDFVRSLETSPGFWQPQAGEVGTAHFLSPSLPNTGSDQPRIQPLLLKGPAALCTLFQPSSGGL